MRQIGRPAPPFRNPVPPTPVLTGTFGHNTGQSLRPFQFTPPVVGTAWQLLGAAITSHGVGVGAGGVPSLSALLILDGEQIDSFLLTEADGTTFTALAAGGTERHGFQSPFTVFDTSKVEIGLNDYSQNMTLFDFRATLQVAYL